MGWRYSAAYLDSGMTDSFNGNPQCATICAVTPWQSVANYEIVEIHEWLIIQRESKKSSLRSSDIFSQMVGNFFVQILHAYYMFLSTLEYKFLFN